MSATPPPPPQQQYAPQPPLNPADEKTWAIVTHVAGIFLGFIPSLIVYLVFKGRGPFLEAHSKTALNFQITMVIAYVVGLVLTAVVIGIFVLIAVWVVEIIFSIIAAVKASQGQYYSYPLTIAFIK
ncbi:DUF4870 domain-containing protein [Microbacteriaceae bacterium VKM Ac-2855]|nr:DUF4870 domain-containing protein [Microbacteriaceae bacterium VKM Ac-2855]